MYFALLLSCPHLPRPHLPRRPTFPIGGGQAHGCPSSSSRDMQAAATTLDDIIEELQLKYERAGGVLDGAAVREIPALSTLRNVHKLLASLSSNLAKVQALDAGVLAAIDAVRRGRASEPAAKRAKTEPVPVQQGLFTQENDTRLKNPKLEFVGAQSLSTEAITELGLYLEETGLETQGHDYLKKKYGVALYPTNDLKDLLPGEIPDVDFSKNKAPANQVQFLTFQLYMELFFRPFSGEDLAFLKEKYILPPGMEKLEYDPTVTPFLIPKLGPFYADVWAEEDAALGAKLSSPGPQHPPVAAYRPRGTFEQINDDTVLSEEISCGPLLSRLLLAVLSIHEAKKGDTRVKPEEPTETLSERVATQLDSDYSAVSEGNDFHSLEERLKRELKYIGIFMSLPDTGEEKLKRSSIVDTDEWLQNREDDEVCAEMRQLQAELKGAVARNRMRKKPLVPLLEEQLAYQEYSTILEDLDKQVDLAYVKRLKAKSKKKKSPEQAPVTTAQQQAANSGLRALLEKRLRWIDNIGRLFKAPKEMKRIPTESVFSAAVHLDEEDADADTETPGSVDVV